MPFIAPPKMDIRPITVDDIDSLAKLFLACFSAPPWNEAWTLSAAQSRIAPMVKNVSCRGVLAHHETLVLGMAFGQVEGWLDGNLFLIQELCVLPDHQNKGIGKAMLAKLVSELKANDDVIAAYLLTDRGSAAEAFYNKIGFTCNVNKIIMRAAVNKFIGHVQA